MEEKSEKRQVRIRLPTSLTDQAPSAAVNIWFTDAEIEWLRDAAELQGYSRVRGLSTYIRDICMIAAADQDESLPPSEKLEAAAAQVAFSIGSWMRMISLCTGGYPLERQMFLARTAFTLKRVGDSTFDPRKVEVGT